MCHGFMLLDAENGIHLELRTLTSWVFIRKLQNLFFFLTSEAHYLNTGSKEGPEPQNLYYDKDFFLLDTPATHSNIFFPKPLHKQM